MAIKRLQRQTAAFPRIGKLRKGAEKPNDKQPGKDLDYFRFDSDDPAAVQRFAAAYGEQPRQINVYLPYESVDENFQTWQEAYTAGAMQHRCDGETCVIWLQKDGKYSQEPVPCPGGCKEVGRLNVIIPELARLAYVTVETHSINDILQLTDNLNAALALRGSLTGIPFVLSRRPQEISTPGKDGKRARYTKWLLFLEPHPDWVRIQLAAMRHNALSVAASGLALPEYRQLTDGQIVDVDTGEIVEDDDEDVDFGHGGRLNDAADVLRQQFNELGEQLYGDQWPTVRKHNTEKISNGMASDYERLTIEQLQRLITGLESLRLKRQAASKPQPQPEAAPGDMLRSVAESEPASEEAEPAF